MAYCIFIRAEKVASKVEQKYLETQTANTSLSTTTNGLNSADSSRNPAQVPALAGSNVKIVQLNYVKATEMSGKLIELFGKDARIVADDKSNSLLIVPLEGRIDRILSFISEYDQMPKQILIEAQIIETSSNFAREMGVSWGTLQATASGKNSSKGTVSFTNPTPHAPNLNAGIAFGSIGHQLLEAKLAAAEHSGEAKIISRPKVVTGDRTLAVIESGISYHVKTLTAYSPTGSVSNSSGPNPASVSGGLQEVSAGLSLNVLPAIVENNLIHLTIDISNSEADQGNSVDGIPGVVRSAAKTSLVVREGGAARNNRRFGKIYHSKI